MSTPLCVTIANARAGQVRRRGHSGLKLSIVALSALATMSTAHAAGFVNGDFENGTASGWTVGTGSRTSVLNDGLVAADYLPGGSKYNAALSAAHSTVISAGTLDPHLGAALGSTVYNGNYSYRVEDTTTGGYASVLTQTVVNYTDPNIFFAWKAVLEGAHGVTDAATMQITLKDVTTGLTLITRQYNAASGGSGVDPRFTYSAATNYFYTAAWQTEQLTIDAALSGHTFSLSVLASDCQPAGHAGYIYVDGFSPTAIIPGVPEPASLALIGAAVLGAAGARRRAKKEAA